MKTSDIIIVGGGIVGCSTAYHLAQAGNQKVTLLERDALGSGGTGKSCAIVRTHYSVEANLVHAVESLKVFENFDQMVGGDIGFRRTGYLILGPEAHRQPMEDVFRAQNAHGIDTDVLSPAEAREIHPLLQFSDVEVIGYDTRAGYCDPHMTTMAYADRARDLGVDLRTGTRVIGLAQRGEVYHLETTEGDFQTPNLILIAGPCTHKLGHMLGVAFPYEVSRHKVLTLGIQEPYALEWPIVKDLTTPDKIYFRPETGGVVLVGTGDHGDPIEDPDTLTDHIDMDHVLRIERLISHRMPAFQEAEVVAGWTGPYDITPDWNPIVGPVPDRAGLYVAVGFSGHGFKLAPTIGESLACEVLGQEPRVPIAMYGMDRFETGRVLSGAYGIGSIS